MHLEAKLGLGGELGDQQELGNNFGNQQALGKDLVGDLVQPDSGRNLDNQQALGKDPVGNQLDSDRNLGNHQAPGNGLINLTPADHARMQPFVSEELKEPQLPPNNNHFTSGWTDKDIDTIACDILYYFDHRFSPLSTPPPPEPKPPGWTCPPLIPPANLRG
ncbi:hypothetical protein CONPUDRAFT_155477 [Coniophora puteana RWD-64-598 SS2]|uniref:Uncharacterized protein n=1 Tax=Coniophora puteana (strain RWD-64-598) TaxID=741705 RepID=A0A5M3MM66_CONPW|nr:uncharacterized protein CONPUDRAFT_155477 [Coniophora puteana RWD-64-598 SS2]EIW80117.1 hypothetical protein CONPUDRAFT_155477 [Coniophora puteana RWD-64-598 SS2]